MLTQAAGARRALPSVDRLLGDARVRDLEARYGRPLVVEALRRLLERERAARSEASGAVPHAFDESALVADCTRWLEELTQSSLRPVFNLTGTVLHTNLGRALLPQNAAQAVVQAMTQPVNLEFDLAGAGRGERDHHVEGWLTRLTGAEAAVVVNNNAAAVFLVLNTLAPRQEVLVSRGELVEIGGSFRIPDIMSRSGCRLREVGTTNRTHAGDYRAAIGPRTAAIMRVHTSNYAIQGFTSTVAESELAAIAREHGLPFVVDLGSGMLLDLRDYALPHEPTAQEALAHGADVVTFSGDKLLGGPQAGLIVGRRSVIERIRKNPLKRALRVDKMTIAALDAVLQLYAQPHRLRSELPTLRALTRPVTEIETQAARVLPHVVRAIAGSAYARVVACASQIGSGSLPVDTLPSAALAIEPAGKGKRSGVMRLAAAFRALPVPVIGRVRDGSLLLDLRCLEDEDTFVAQLSRLAHEANP
jgi:L-seryl-tRNA(Ser) seleniumtransferase